MRVSGKLFTAVYGQHTASITFNFDYQNHQDEIRSELTGLLDQIAQHGVTELAYFCNHDEHGIISPCTQQSILDCHKASVFADHPKIFLDNLTGTNTHVAGVELVDIRWWLIKCKHLYGNKQVDWKQHHTLVYLPGKPQKIERSLVLYSLMQSVLKDHLEYSFRPQTVYDPEHAGFLQGWGVKCEDVCASFAEYVNTDWLAWSKSMAREIDQSADSDWQDWTSTGREGDQILNHRLRIVVETWAWTPEYLTEKTFAPLILGVPFLLWDQKNVEFLESMGFKSFDSLLPAYLEHSTNFLTRSQQQIRRAEMFWKLSYNTEFQDQVDAIILHNRKKVHEYWNNISAHHKFINPLLPARI